MKSKSTTTNISLYEQLSQPWKPHAYMKKAIKFVLENACAALFLDPGLGKTSIILAVIKILKKKGMIDKVLLIAPLRVCYSVWPREIQKWADFNGLTIEILHGKDKEKALNRQADIYVINPEGLDWLLQVQKTKGRSGKTVVHVDLRRWKSLGFDVLCIDELSKFKHTSTNRFKALKLVLHTFKRRWGLTGSPASNGLLDLFGQCYILDQGRSLGPFITHYKTKYFKPIDHSGFVWVPQEGAEALIYERISPLALRMAAEDYIEMPTVIENNIRIDLPDEVQRIYESLEDDLIAAIESNVITAANAAVASGKCSQVANGGIYLTPDLEITGFKLPKQKREWLNLHMEKVDALEDLIDELQGAPILVAYDFQHDLDRLRERFGADIAVIGGGISPKKTSELIEAWNKGDLNKIFVHPQSAAHGLDGLQHVGQHVAWHSMTWDFELYDQLIRRIKRQGNKSKRIFVHHILARGTIDEIKLKTLKMKNRGQQSLFNGLKELAKMRRSRK